MTSGGISVKLPFLLCARLAGKTLFVRPLVGKQFLVPR